MTAENALESLKTFLKDAENDIDFVVEKFLPSLVRRGRIPEHIYVAIVYAWHELKPRFEEATPKIDKVHIDDLIRVGLAGSQLDVKLQIYKNISERFRRTLRPYIMRRLFRILIAIKDSLCPLIGCLLEPVDEFLVAIDSITP